MRAINPSEMAILELVALQPLSVLPDAHVKAAERLRKRGLLLRREGTWYPTANGLTATGRTVH